MKKGTAILLLGIGTASVVYSVLIDRSLYSVDLFLSKREKIGVGLDLGCGNGNWGQTLKKHCNYLIGVDKNASRLKRAYAKGYYNEVVCADITKFEIPEYVNFVFIFEAIEHLSKEEGLKLLSRINKPFLLSTPSVFGPTLYDGHKSLWAIEDFENLGYQVWTVNTGLKDLVFGKRIIAFKS